MTAGSVALLNASYEPLAKVPSQHAVKMLFRRVATVEEAGMRLRVTPYTPTRARLAAL